MKSITDNNGNNIGNGTYHVSYHVEEIPNVSVSVSESATTESVYVTYKNGEKTITVRFSWHESNAVKFGDQLNGNTATKDEIMFHLGMKTRTFIPNTSIYIATRKVAKKQLASFEEAALSISEMYNLGTNADLSEFVGKIAKGSNYLILSDVVKENEETRINQFGQTVKIGTYIYN